MIIIQDTREQHPLAWVSDDVLTEIIVQTLPVGDYTARYTDGTLCPIYFERKSISDLFGTMTRDYARFKAEMARAKTMGVTLILAIEGSMTKVVKGHKYSRVPGKTIVRKLMTLWLKYGLVPMFFKNREEMAMGIREFYESYGRNYKRGTTRG